VGLRERFRARLLDWAMRRMNEMRPDTIAGAQGEVLEVGFGTGLNLRYYGEGVSSLVGLDPKPAEGLIALEERLAMAKFPIEQVALRADGTLPFDAGRFDTVVTTWTLCSIPDPLRALAEMGRVLKPGGQYVFIEHGKAPTAGTARWQDRLNPLWKRLADGCNMNRPIDQLVEQGGFELTTLDRFRGEGPGVLAHMYRGIAHRIQ
jgi:SAM-dependent methyltransferase